MPVVVRAMAVIGAMDGLERLLDLRHRRAEPFQHRLDDVVALDQDAVDLDLGREMAVPQVPGEFDLVNGAAGADFQQLLFGGDDLDMAGAVLEFEEVAMLKHDRLLEVEHHDIVMRHVQQLAPQVALVMGQRDDIDRCGLDRAGLDDAG